MNQIFEEILRDIKTLAGSILWTVGLATLGVVNWFITFVRDSATLPPELSQPYLIGMILILSILILRRTRSSRRSKSYESSEMVVDGILMLFWPGTLMMLVLTMITRASFRHYEGNS
jgi:hypothetical protein